MKTSQVLVILTFLIFTPNSFAKGEPADLGSVPAEPTSVQTQPTTLPQKTEISNVAPQIKTQEVINENERPEDEIKVQPKTMEKLKEGLQNMKAVLGKEKAKPSKKNEDLKVDLSSKDNPIRAMKANNEGREIVIQINENIKEAREEQQNNTPPGEKPEPIELNPEDLDPALEKFLMALSDSPGHQLYRFNLAVVQQLQGKLKDASKEYDLLLEEAKGDFRFAVLFNRAILEGQQNKTDEALDFYQQALEIKPDSKEVKTNIELLLQKKQGEGDGKGKDKNKDKDGKSDKQDGEGKNKDQQDKGQNPDDGKQKQKKQKPKSLSEKEIKKILNELKNQEQKIRAKDMKDNLKETPRDKDW